MGGRWLDTSVLFLYFWGRAENKVSSLSSSVSLPSASLLATGTGVLTKHTGEVGAGTPECSELL